MASREEKVTAGFFVLVGLVLIIVTVALIAGIRLRRSENVYFVNFTESVYGLDAESTVTYQGVPAGRVKAIEFTNDVSIIRVMLGLDPKLPIKVATRATLKQHFITSKTIIELVGGKNEDANLPPESFIEWKETGLMVVQRSVPEMLNKISNSLDAVREVLSQENVARFSRIMDNVDGTLAEVRFDIDRIARSTEGLINQLLNTAASVNEVAVTAKGSVERVEGDVKSTLVAARGLVERTDQQLDPALAQARLAIEQVTRIGTQLDQLAKRINGFMEPATLAISRAASLFTRTDDLIADNRTEIADALNSIRRAARALELLLLQIERNPGFLLSSPREDAREIPGR